MQTVNTLQNLINDLDERRETPALLALQPQGIEHWSSAKLKNHVDQLAAGLHEAGIGQGDLVGFVASNSPLWIVACLATLRAGAVVIPVDVQFADDVLKHVIKDSNPRLIFTVTEQMDRLDRLGLKESRQCFTLDAEDNDRSWRQLLKQGEHEFPPVKSEDTAVLFYTSGTTGKPKGVPLSHKNLAFQVNRLIQTELVTEADRVLLPLPLHHVYPFVIGMLAPLVLGMPIVLPRALTGPQLVRALQEGKASILIGVPRLYRALYETVESRARSQGKTAATLLQFGLWFSKRAHRLNLPLGPFLFGSIRKRLGPHLRILASGGSPLDPELAENLEALGWKVAVGYGLTETSPLLTIKLPGRGRLESRSPTCARESGCSTTSDASTPSDGTSTSELCPTTEAQLWEGEVQQIDEAVRESLFYW